MRTTLTIFATLFMITTATAQLKHPIRDAQGRHVIPRCFVVNTEDKQGNIYYTTNDYHRMVRMGANFQVIRLRLGALGGYPGNLLEESYLLHLDSLVQMGKNVGLEVEDPGDGYSPSEFIWDSYRQQLVILKWPVDNENVRVLLQPGIYQEILQR